MSTKTCNVPACGKSCGKGLVMCPGHWKAVPAAKKAKINQTKPGAGIPPTPAYAAAMGDAIKALREMKMVATDPKPKKAPAVKQRGPSLQRASDGAAARVAKRDLVDWWNKLPADQTLRPTPIPASHKGSTIDEDSIRITGSLEYIEQVLSNLKGLRRFENADTRLELKLAELTEKGSSTPIPGRFRCSVQVWKRAGRRGSL